MLKKLITWGLAASMAFSAPASAKGIEDYLDDAFEKVSVDERRGEWRDHWNSSTGLTLSDAFLFNHIGYGRESNNKDNSEENHRTPQGLAAKTRFLETTAYQSYIMTQKRELTPSNAAADVAGVEFSYWFFPKISSIAPSIDAFIDSVENINLKNYKNYKNPALITAAVIGFSYTLKRQRYPVDFHAKEEIDNTTFEHMRFFMYYTLRTTTLLESVGYKKHTPESLAWRYCIGLGIIKEFPIDALFGSGASLLDFGADVVGVTAGYGGVKLFKLLKNKNMELMPFNNGVRLDYKF